MYILYVSFLTVIVFEEHIP